jgi:hypothetical protein
MGPRPFLQFLNGLRWAARRWSRARRQQDVTPPLTPTRGITSTYDESHARRYTSPQLASLYAFLHEAAIMPFKQLSTEPMSLPQGTRMRFPIQIMDWHARSGVKLRATSESPSCRSTFSSRVIICLAQLSLHGPWPFKL